MILDSCVCPSVGDSSGALANDYYKHCYEYLQRTSYGECILAFPPGRSMQTPAGLPAAEQPLVWHPSLLVLGRYEGPVLILSHTAIRSAI